ncbi:MAG: hypothetical protein H0W72_10045 [Planctomycetes bacterium]|nr:hypothetical protein [Planctomycetota bacterium]
MRCLRLGGLFGSRFLLGTLMVLTACGDRVGQPMVPVEQARLDHRRIAMRILAVHRAERIAGPSAGASHLIEVECLGGDGRPNGTRLTLPYDDWNVGAPPPEPGTIVTTSPAAWLQRAPASKGVPREGWDR